MVRRDANEEEISREAELSDTMWQRDGAHYRWRSRRSMNRIWQRVKELTPRSRCHADIREVIASLNPTLRGGNYFRTGNAATGRQSATPAAVCAAAIAAKASVRPAPSRSRPALFEIAEKSNS